MSLRFDAGVAWRLARRELRGGLAGFRVFLACLMLGVAAISAVGLVRAAIERGLQDQGAVLLGGDAQMEFTYRFATPEERAWMAERASRVAEVVDFRSMAVVGEGDAAERALTQVKGVDALYPLTGAVVLEPAVPLADALAGSGGLPGAVMDKVLVDRLGLTVGGTLPPWGSGVPTGRGAAARAGFDGGGVCAGAADDRHDRGAGGVGAAGAGDALRDEVPAGLAGGHGPRRHGEGGGSGVPRQGHGLDRPAAGRARRGAVRGPDRIVPGAGGAGGAGRGGRGGFGGGAGLSGGEGADHRHAQDAWGRRGG